MKNYRKKLKQSLYCEGFVAFVRSQVEYVIINNLKSAIGQELSFYEVQSEKQEFMRVGY